MFYYTVSVPVTAVIHVEVESEDALTEKDVISKALESESLSLERIEEWECHKQIIQGNVFHGIQNDAEVIDEWSDED